MPPSQLWQTLVGDAPISLPSRPGALRRLRGELAGLSPGSRVALVHSGPLAGARLWWLARGAGLRRERSYLAIPSTAAPLFVIERSSAVQSYFVEHLLTVPPRLVAGAAAASFLVTMAARTGGARLLGLPAPSLTVWRRM